MFHPNSLLLFEYNTTYKLRILFYTVNYGERDIVLEIFCFPWISWYLYILCFQWRYEYSCDFSAELHRHPSSDIKPYQGRQRQGILEGTSDSTFETGFWSMRSNKIKNIFTIDMKFWEKASKKPSTYPDLHLPYPKLDVQVKVGFQKDPFKQS